MGSRSRRLIAAFGALVYAIAGLRLTLSSIAILMTIAPQVTAESGGVGFVVDTIDVLVVPFVLLGLAAAVGNRMILPWVRRSDSLVRTIHRGHTVMLVLGLGVPIVAALLLNARPDLAFLLFPISGIALGLLFLLSAALLGMSAARQNPER